MRKMVNRVVFYLIGLFFVSLGIAVSVNSNLGVSPVSSVPITISRISGWNEGACVTGVYCFYILLQAIILRRDFKIKNLLQILFSTLFGYFVNFSLFLVDGFAIPTYFGKLAMTGIAALLIGLGLCFYLTPDVIPLPMEGLALAVSKKANIPMHRAKVILDCSSVVLAVIISLVATRQLIGVREGTVILALLAGRIMGWLSRFIKPWLVPLCFDLPKDEELVREEEAMEESV